MEGVFDSIICAAAVGALIPGKDAEGEAAVVMVSGGLGGGISPGGGRPIDPRFLSVFSSIGTSFTPSGNGALNGLSTEP